MKITQLTAENVKRLKAVRIKPDGSIVVVGGKNAQGKSSVLDAIVMALAGKKAQGAKPVRDGEDKARIVIELDEMVVTRTITKEGGGAIKVTSKDGAVYPSPQAILDGLCSKLTFDPLAFMREAPKKQRDMLQGLVGLDFTEADAKRKGLFDERTEVNREVKSLKARIDGMDYYEDAPAELVDTAALLAKLNEAKRHNAGVEASRAKERDLIEEIKQLEHKLKMLKSELKATQDSLQDAELRDTDAHEDRINRADSMNAKLRANQQRDRATSEMNALAAQAENLTAEIERIDIDKTNAIGTAQFPVGGLNFGQDGITYNGIPFEQCSSAEQLRVSVAMGIAMNPRLKVLLIKDGSLLDEDSLAMVAKMAEEADAQVWIERVGKGQECSVIIEDGEVEDGDA